MRRRRHHELDPTLMGLGVGQQPQGKCNVATAGFVDEAVDLLGGAQERDLGSAFLVLPLRIEIGAERCAPEDVEVGQVTMPRLSGPHVFEGDAKPSGPCMIGAGVEGANGICQPRDDVLFHLLLLLRRNGNGLSEGACHRACGPRAFRHVPRRRARDLARAAGKAAQTSARPPVLASGKASDEAAIGGVLLTVSILRFRKSLD
jgi:hypothetical protein